MPYSERDHSPRVAPFLGPLSSFRINAENFLIPLYSNMLMPHVDLYGKLAIVTGANSGLGFETARAFASMGARVVLACRSMQKGEEAKDRIIEVTGNDQVEVELLDCASFQSVRDFLERWEQREVKQLNILVNNAGGFVGTATKSAEGFEQAYQSNHLSHVLLTHTLLNRGHFAPDARIVSVSSVGFYFSVPLDEHTTDASDILEEYPMGAQLPMPVMVQAYQRTKAAQAIWSMVLQRRLSKDERWKKIVVQSCHPGTVKSSIWTQDAGLGSSFDRLANLTRSMVQWFGISTEQGAVVPVWLATAKEPTKPELGGLFWDRLQWKWVPAWSLETARQEMLWSKWCKDAGVHLQ
ncbi:NAD(P)-binding protein [Ceratobasidium sp. AG-I]|nr:NAD(P)-binding protein [Ceratobasidium sp. AG-I]